MTRTEKVLVHGSTWVVAGSGFAYGWMKYFLRHDDPYSAVNHPWQPTALAWHVVAAPLLVFAVGLIAREHILSRIQEEGDPPRTRRSGLLAALLVLPMVLSGYGLQVTSEPAVRSALVAIHLTTGVPFFLIYVVHAAVARLAERRSRRGAESSAAPAMVVLWSGSRARPPETGAARAASRDRVL